MLKAETTYVRNVFREVPYWTAFGTFLGVALLTSGCAGIQSRYYEVAKGDTLQKIAQEKEVPLAALVEFNQVKLAHGLRPGTKLFIPFEENPEWDRDFEHDRRPSSSEVGYSLGAAEYLWPVVGRVTSPFGLRSIGHRGSRNHEGIDILAPKGAKVKVARSGHVIYAGNGLRGYGNLVIVRHLDGYSTIYAHLKTMKTRRGQYVNRGTTIGLVGKTGRSTGYHLHFEVRSKTQPLNPLHYLPPRPELAHASNR